MAGHCSAPRRKRRSSRAVAEQWQVKGGGRTGGPRIMSKLRPVAAQVMAQCRLPDQTIHNPVFDCLDSLKSEKYGGGTIRLIIHRTVNCRFTALSGMEVWWSKT
eukprot:1137978-Pelagomonas_calceolata.AAC.1